MESGPWAAASNGSNTLPQDASQQALASEVHRLRRKLQQRGIELLEEKQRMQQIEQELQDVREAQRHSTQQQQQLAEKLWQASARHSQSTGSAATSSHIGAVSSWGVPSNARMSSLITTSTAPTETQVVQARAVFGDHAFIKQELQQSYARTQQQLQTLETVDSLNSIMELTDLMRGCRSSTTSSRRSTINRASRCL